MCSDEQLVSQKGPPVLIARSAPVWCSEDKAVSPRAPSALVAQRAPCHVLIGPYGISKGPRWSVSLRGGPLSLKAKIFPIQYKNRNSKKGPDCRWPLQPWRLRQSPLHVSMRRGSKEERSLGGGFGTSED